MVKTEEGYEIPADGLWEAVRLAFRRAVRKVAEAHPAPLDRVAGIGVCGMGEAGFPLDRRGRPLTGAVPWHDARSGPQVEALRRRVPPDEMYAITGLVHDAKHTLTKLLWYRDARPDVFESTEGWVGVPEYVVYRMTGRRVTDRSLACRTMLYDIHKRAWSKRLMAEIDWTEARLPEVRPAPEAKGSLEPGPAREFGLRPGIPVAVAGHDHITGSLASGIADVGDVFHSVGTAEGVMALIDGAGMSKAPVPGVPMVVGHHLLPGKGYCMIGLGHAGGAVEWFLAVMGWTGTQKYERLVEALEATPPGPGPITFVPRLSEASSGMGGGAFLGLSREHTGADLARAVVTGIDAAAMEARRALAGEGDFPGALVVSGGIAYNPAWLENRATMWGREIQVPPTQETPGLGAAIVAACAAGIGPDLEDAARRAREANRRVAPDPKRIQEAERWYRTVWPAAREAAARFAAGAL